MRGSTLYNVSDPVNPQDVATKEYADNVRGGGWINRKEDGTSSIKTTELAHFLMVKFQPHKTPFPLNSLNSLNSPQNNFISNAPRSTKDIK